MIILFVLLGVLLLGGGVATILDGLPYLVLERGFTQVIVGTVVATGGVVILALSRVLVELRKVRTTLSNAMMAVSVGSLSGEAPASASRSSDTVLAVGAGAAAGIGAALVADKLADGGDETPSAGERAPEEEPEPDLFSRSLEQALAETENEAGSAIAAGESSPAERDEMEGEAHSAPHSDAVDGETRSEAVAAETLATRFEPAWEMAQEEAQAPPHDHVELDAADAESVAGTAPQDESPEPKARTEAWLGWPEPEHEAVTEPEAEAKDREKPVENADDFGSLRESLSGRLSGEDTISAVGAEPWRGGSLQEAESWMAPAGGRREPWFETPAATAVAEPIPETDETSRGDRVQPLEPPAWPPQTREPIAAAPDTSEPAPNAEEPDAIEARPELSNAPADPLDTTSTADKQESAVAQSEEPVAPEPAPAASDEGIVGAYQVGDAHFTIFADGSIKARTPDGDYSFASMDELKTYLASEKSRLGV